MDKPKFGLIGVALVVLVVLFVLKLWLPAPPPSKKKGPKAPTPRAKAATSCAPGPALKQAFARANQAARSLGTPGVHKQLLAITQANKSLRWKTIDGVPHVLMATWTAYKGYPAPGKPYTTPAKFDIWVTSAPHFQKACAVDWSKPTCATLRIKQKLGLSPTKKKTLVVTFWVKPADLFRPCRDPEITDSQCLRAFRKDVSPAHKQWFAQQATWLHPKGKPSRGAPWTQLGYTYDWSDKSPSHVGLSEFVIHRKRQVLIHDIKPTSTYCRP